MGLDASGRATRDDGAEPLEVARDRIVVVHRAEAAFPAAGRLPVGTSVAAKWGEAAYYIATITGVDADGKYAVKWDDGDTPIEVPRDPIAPLPAR